jgi:hypothetical protein
MNVFWDIAHDVGSKHLWNISVTFYKATWYNIPEELLN